MRPNYSIPVTQKEMIYRIGGIECVPEEIIFLKTICLSY